MAGGHTATGGAHRLLAKARTLWRSIDAGTGKPVNVGLDVWARFSVTEEV